MGSAARQQRCLGWFRRALSPDFFTALKQDLEIVENSRVFALPVTIWLMMMQRLSPKGTLAGAVNELIQGNGRELLEPCKRVLAGNISASTGAYSQARQQVPVEAAWRVTQRTFEYLQHTFPQSDLRDRLFLLDGSSIRLAHSQANAGQYPVARNRYGDSHWPVLRIAVMHHVTSALAMAPAFGPMYGPHATSEQALAEPLIRRLPPGSIMIADRNFGVFSVAWCAHSLGRTILVRMTAARAKALLGGDLKADSEHPVTWRPSHADRRAHPELPAQARIEGRLIVAHGAGEVLFFFTTLAEPSTLVVDLYKERWNIETDLRSLKDQVRLHTIEARSPTLVANELYLAVAAYNLIRTVMTQASAPLNIAPRRLSFSRSREALWAFIRAVANLESHGQFEHHWQLLLRAISQSKLPNRPGRSSPRAVWPKPRSFPTRKQNPRQ
jgi:hypothetical protein